MYKRQGALSGYKMSCYITFTCLLFLPLSIQLPTIDRNVCFDSHRSCATKQECAYTFVLPRPNGEECPSIQNTVKNMASIQAENEHLKQQVSALEDSVAEVKNENDEIRRELVQTKTLLRDIEERLNSTSGNEWKLVFKAVADYGGSVWDLWDSASGRNENNRQAMALNNVYEGHYKSSEIENWENLGVREVKFAVYEDGVQVSYLTFNGVGSDKNNWFSRDRLISSPYRDLFDVDLPIYYFSIEGYQKERRAFYISGGPHIGCPLDVGWTAVIDDGDLSDDCPWGRSAGMPVIIYSRTSSMVNFNTDAAARADFMAVFIKT